MNIGIKIKLSIFISKIFTTKQNNIKNQTKMKKLSSFLAIISFSCITFAQTVTLGTQEWMTKNLDVSTFRNGDTILNANTINKWLRANQNKQPAFVYYKNNKKNGAISGKLYNWYAVNDPRGLAPEGYHIPSDKEWSILIDFLGGESVAGKEMKNTNGFSSIPGGVYFSNEGFGKKGASSWWSSTEETTLHSALGCYHNHYTSKVFRTSAVKGFGFSVRCLKD